MHDNPLEDIPEREAKRPELLNVRGQVQRAFEVLDYLYTQVNLRNRELQQHRRVLKEAMPVYVKLFTDPTASGEDRRLQAALQ